MKCLLVCSVFVVLCAGPSITTQISEPAYYLPHNLHPPAIYRPQQHYSSLLPENYFYPASFIDNADSYGPSRYYESESPIPVYREEPPNRPSYDIQPSVNKQTHDSNYGSGPGPIIQAAVITRHKVRYYDVPTVHDIKPTTIEVGVQSVPINILLRSSSSRLNVEQVHEGAQGTYQETQSEDQPHTLKHTVTKPILQEIYELITPYRLIRQELKPVQEVIETIVARQAKKQYSQNDQELPSEAPDAQLYAGPIEQHPVERTLDQIYLDKAQAPDYGTQDDSYNIQHEQALYSQASEIRRVEQEVLNKVGQDYITASSNALLTTLYGSPAMAASSSFGHANIARRQR